jgi:hypothetical protein
MQKNAKFLALAKALPVALMMSGPATPALSFELNAGSTIGTISSEMSLGHLHAAQELVQQLHACGVRSLLVGDTIVPLSEVQLALSALAQGDDSLWASLEGVLQAANTGARSLFITDDGKAAVCAVAEDTFVTSSSGPV